MFLGITTRLHTEPSCAPRRREGRRRPVHYERSERQNALLKIYDARDAMAGLVIGSKIACKAGCNACCAMAVPVSLEEAWILRGHEENTGTDNQLGWMAQMELWQDTGDNGKYWAAGQLCPFVDGERGCSAYPSRPFSCRIYNSVDASQCHPGGKGGTLLPVTDRAFALMAKALHDNDDDHYLMGAAMLRVSGHISHAELRSYRIGNGKGSRVGR